MTTDYRREDFKTCVLSCYHHKLKMVCSRNCFTWCEKVKYGCNKKVSKNKFEARPFSCTCVVYSYFILKSLIKQLYYSGDSLVTE